MTTSLIFTEWFVNSKMVHYRSSLNLETTQMHHLTWRRKLIMWLFITWQWAQCVEFRLWVRLCGTQYSLYNIGYVSNALIILLSEKFETSPCWPITKIQKFHKWSWINWGRELTSDIIEFQLWLFFMVFIKAENFWLYSTKVKIVLSSKI